METLRHLLVDKLSTDDVPSVLKLLWNAKPETESRLRGASSVSLIQPRPRTCEGENTARRRGHLDQLLPKRQPLTRGDHAAMPTDLRQRPTVARSDRCLALEFAILTAARSGEVLVACWDEADLERAAVPAERTKAGREHRVPLSPRSLRMKAAYRRGDLFDKRRKLMDAWAAYCAPRTGKVVAFKRKEASSQNEQQKWFTVVCISGACLDHLSKATEIGRGSVDRRYGPPT